MWWIKNTQNNSTLSHLSTYNPSTFKHVVQPVIYLYNPLVSQSHRWEFVQSGISSLTCCAYSMREIRYVAGGNTPGNTAFLIESKASLSRPHSIILLTLLKSATIAWRNNRTMVKWKKYMERREEKTWHSKRQMAERREARGQEGNRNKSWVGIRSSWGSFLTIAYWQIAYGLRTSWMEIQE